jgi:hypothetical protein
MYLQIKLEIEDSITKDGVPKELQKTLLMVPVISKEYKFIKIDNVKHLIEAIYNEIKFIVDLDKVSLNQIYLSTSDGFMIPPFTGIDQIMGMDLNKE